LSSKVCINTYWTIFLDGRAFVAQDNGEAISSLNGLVTSLYCNTMPVIINEPYGDLTGQTEPQIKKSKMLDSSINLGERDTGGGWVEPNTAYGAVDHPNAILNAKWAKAVKARPSMKLLDLRSHAQMEGKPATMKVLNKLVRDKRCLMGLVTGECRNPKYDFVHTLRTDTQAITVLCNILDNGVKALKLA
jgi:hypothetical protein